MNKATLLILIALTYGFGQASYAETAEARLQKFFGEQPASITPLNAHLSRVTVAGQSYLASRDGRYLFAGTVIDTESRQNLVEVESRRHRQQQLAEAPDNWFIRYPAKAPAKYTVTVFTDIDCPYCRKMHSYMDAYNELGITVNYVLMPRAGLGSASFNKAVAAFCADNPGQAVTRAMNGETLPAKQCAHTITEQYELAHKLGVRATPTIILPNGKVQAGLVEPKQLQALLTDPS